MTIEPGRKITPEMIKRERLVFYPKTEEEAREIQLRLFKMGADGAESGQTVSRLDECAQKGMVSDRGTIYYSPDKSRPGIRCSLADIPEDYRPTPQEEFASLSADGKMLALFNMLAEVAERIERIEREVGPRQLDKPARLPQGGVR